MAGKISHRNKTGLNITIAQGNFELEKIRNSEITVNRPDRLLLESCYNLTVHIKAWPKVGLYLHLCHNVTLIVYRITPSTIEFNMCSNSVMKTRDNVSTLHFDDLKIDDYMSDLTMINDVDISDKWEHSSWRLTSY